ncbi:hypothetical protein M1L60_44575 [Actinoplanes sp. TRM 88003]|uniref:Lipoprotein n=1 Tax=Paractinoplanes aksuensis TaxID=2939490 RepID=A0ABT1E3G0_9ACTN|nr:hypothetical protein [Actinoplanes aksuensis]MCO8277674.1 hypothetical protein [Actinoplanes aksuensis]
MVAVGGLGIAGCTVPAETSESAVTTPTTRPSVTASLMTLRSLEVGDTLTTTAAVQTILAASAFTVEDADLPDQGMLILGERPQGLRPHSLVTVKGTIERFDFERFSGTYQLPSPEPFERFGNRKIVVAERIRLS